MGKTGVGNTGMKLEQNLDLKSLPKSEILNPSGNYNLLIMTVKKQKLQTYNAGMNQRLRKVVWSGGGVRCTVLSPSDAALFWMRCLGSEAISSAGTADTSAASQLLQSSTHFTITMT